MGWTLLSTRVLVFDLCGSDIYLIARGRKKIRLARSCRNAYSASW